MGKTSYVIALGSNRRHHKHGAPAKIISAALETLGKRGVEVIDRAPVFHTTAVGPAGRRFANSAALLRFGKNPSKLLELLKTVERDFGRRRGRRWGPRVIDLDIILWSGGMWIDRDLAVPHPGFRSRRFVLDPVNAIAADWRDPVTDLHVRHLKSRLWRTRPVDRRQSAA